MKTGGGVGPEQLRDFLEALPDLLESLRAQGYGVGPRQHVAVHELVGSLVARGQLPPTLLELRDWLGPLVCFTPAQQEEFGQQYLRWLEDRDLEHPPPDEPDEPDEPEKNLENGESGKKEWTAVGRGSAESEGLIGWLRAHRLALAVAASAALAVALAFVLVPRLCTSPGSWPCPAAKASPTPTPTPSVVSSPTPTPAVTPEVVVTHTPDPYATPEPADTGYAWDVEKQTPPSGAPTPVDLSKIELNNSPPPEPPRGFIERNFKTVLALTLVLPFLGLGLWRLARRRRRMKESERWQGARPRYDKIKVRGVRERVFQSAALRPIARGLRRYRSVESRQLDARSTVLASVGRGGLFTPVYGRRRALPEYLVLIDRVGFGDQLAQFNSDIAARLAENDVYLDTYYFHGDPRRCREPGANSPQLSLTDLAARHPEHFLVVFSDGTGLMSTTTGRPEPFVEQFMFWRGRAMLTPIPKIEHDYREWALAREGLRVLPANLDGLRALVGAVSPDAQAVREPGFDSTPPYPDILVERPALWNERGQPPPNHSRRLLKHLRRFLGDGGYELLCACAVYPVMQWGVTLFLAYELLSPREVEEVLPRLLRLPWFRNGTMPAWLRRALVNELPRARRRLVRERLEHLLLAFLEDPARGLESSASKGAGAHPDAAGASLLSLFGERLAAWRRRRRLRRRLEPAPAHSPLAEPVFLNFITGNSGLLALPEPVRRTLFSRGVAAFGLRLAPALAFVTAVVLAAVSTLLLSRPDETNFYTPGVPDNLWSLLLSPTPEPSPTTAADFVYTPTTIRRGETVNVRVTAALNGAYDFTHMRLAPSGAGVRVLAGSRWMPDGARISYKDRLSDKLTADGNAPLDPTELLLYDGDKLRARLPFNVLASAAERPRPSSTPTPRPDCPDLSIIATDFDLSGRATLVAPISRPGQYSYRWTVSGPTRIVSGQGTSSIEVLLTEDTDVNPTFKVEVTGLPRGCPNVSGFNPPSPERTTPLKASVEPQSVTVCPDDPKLNNPQDSTVRVTVLTESRFDISFSDGKFNQRDSITGNTHLYDWNLSGMSPGTYTVTVSPATAGAGQSGPTRPSVTRSVTVKSCDGRVTDSGSKPAAAGIRKSTNSLVEQNTALLSVRTALYNSKELTYDEAAGVAQAQARLNNAIAYILTRVNSLSILDAAARADLTGLLGPVNSAVSDLDARVNKVRNDDARKKLGDSVNGFRSTVQEMRSLINQ